jgi:hypothetical protein
LLRCDVNMRHTPTALKVCLRVVRYTRGKPARRYERLPGKRAEALDCAVMAFGARAAAPIQLDQREADLRSPVRATPPATVIRSAWMSR